MKSNKKFNAIDLFSGIGGFHQAIVNFGGDVVLASDIDKFANETYKKNYGLNSNLDITKIEDQEILKLPKKLDLITAGFPCQTFSNAGKKKGFKDSNRGKLIFSVRDLVKKLQKLKNKPQVLILENVKHLVNHNRGETLKKILSIFRNLNYVTYNKPIIISPHHLGIPQHRPRIIIPFVLNENKSKKTEKIIKKQIKEILNIDKSQKLDYVEKYLEEKINPRYIIDDKKLIKVFVAWEEFVKNVIRPINRTLPVIWIDELTKNYPLDNLPVWKKKYLQDMRLVYSINKKFIDSWIKKFNVKDWKTRDKKLEWQAGINNYSFKNSFIQLRQSGIRCRKKNMFPALVAMVQVPIFYDKKIHNYRMLTPREVANIQSFPKNFIIHKKDFQAYKQFGNAVNVEVIKHVLSKLSQFIEYE